MSHPFAMATNASVVFLDEDRRGEARFTVSNQSGRSIEGRARVVTEEAEAESWVSLRGQAQRTFSTAGTEEYAVEIDVPPDAPSGSYTVRLDMVGEERPDEQYVEGPAMTFEVPESELVSPSFSRQIVAAMVAMLLVGGLLAYQPLSESVTSTVPEGAGLTLDQATDTLRVAGFPLLDFREEHTISTHPNRSIGTNSAAQTESDPDSSVLLHVFLGSETLNRSEAAREAEKVIVQWMEAMEEGDAEAMVELVSFPFFWDNEILTSASEVQARIQEPVPEETTIDSIKSSSVGEYKDRFGASGDRLLSRMQLSDDDLIVWFFVSTESLSGEPIGFYFRRLSDSVEMVGFWG